MACCRVNIRWPLMCVSTSPGLQPRRRGRTADAFEQDRRAVDAEQLRLARRHVRRVDAEVAADHAAVRDQLVHDAAHEIHRNRKAQALRHRAVAQCGADDGGVDADELAARVHERAARVADVDRGVGLDEVLECRDAELPSAGGAHDPHRDRLAQAERVADREHDFPDLEVVGAAERDLGQIRQFDLQQRELRFRVRADYLRHRYSAVGELHPNLVGVRMTCQLVTT